MCPIGGEAGADFCHLGTIPTIEMSLSYPAILPPKNAVVDDFNFPKHRHQDELIIPNSISRFQPQTLTSLGNSARSHTPSSPQHLLPQTTNSTNHVPLSSPPDLPERSTTRHRRRRPSSSSQSEKNRTYPPLPPPPLPNPNPHRQTSTTTARLTPVHVL